MEKKINLTIGTLDAILPCKTITFNGKVKRFIDDKFHNISVTEGSIYIDGKWKDYVR